MPRLREDLQRAQLVARAGDGHRIVEGKDIHHLELPDHRVAIERVPRRDPRDDGVGHQFLAIDVDPRLARGDVHVAAEVVHDPHLVAARLGGGDKGGGAVELRVAGENENFHAREIGKEGKAELRLRPIVMRPAGQSQKHFCFVTFSVTGKPSRFSFGA